MREMSHSFLDVTQILECNHIPYMIVGSIASMVYGEPRLTHDIDIVIHLLPKDAARLEQLFSPDEYYCPPLEVVRSEVIHQGQFNLIHHDSGLKIDLVIRKANEHAQVEFTRRRRITLWEGVEAYFASPEDIILKKLDYFRVGASEKHLTDIRGILSETMLDMDYLNAWIAKLHLEDEWRQV
jgi:hypothetical protein